MKQLLILTCFFTIAAGIWLAVMENVLRHSGFQARTTIAVLIALQSLATLSALLVSSRFSVRFLVMAGSVAVALLGASAIFRTMQAAHFEGFALLIGTALLLQGALTLAALSRPSQQN